MEDAWRLKGIGGALKRYVNCKSPITKAAILYWDSPSFKLLVGVQQKEVKILVLVAEMLKFKAAKKIILALRMEDGKLIVLSHRTQRNVKLLKQAYSLLSECYSDGMTFRLFSDGLLLPYGYIFKKQKNENSSSNNRNQFLF